MKPGDIVRSAAQASRMVLTSSFGIRYDSITGYVYPDDLILVLAQVDNETEAEVLVVTSSGVVGWQFAHNFTVAP